MPPNPTDRRPPSRLPWILLLMMTVASFGGPFGIWIVLRGGERPDWPPDRLVEWVVFAGTVAFVVVMMVACLGLGLVNRRNLDARRAGSPPGNPT